MDDLEKSVIESLDGREAALLPFIPYLLQDFWELGSSGEDIIAMFRKQGLDKPPGKKVLDLGCGKGAVSIQLAETFGFHATGIDALPDFIEEAKRKAAERGVAALCEFRVADIREEIENIHGYHIAVMNAVGPVLGNFRETVSKLKKCLLPGGYILIDDAFVEDGKQEESGKYTAYSDILRQFDESGVELIDEQVPDSGYISEACVEETDWIRKRAGELKSRHPEKAALFDGYVKSQEDESRVMSEQVKCVLWLLKSE